MRSLFFKIFLSFCVIVVVVGATLETSSILAHYYEGQWLSTLHSIMPEEAEKCARLFENSGKQRLQDYLADLQRRKAVRFYFFDEDGNPILASNAPVAVLAMAKDSEMLNKMARQNLSLVEPKKGIAVRLVDGPSGRKYSLAFQQSPSTMVLLSEVSEAVGSHPYLRLLGIALFAALLCFVLTRHITRPILRLRAAASSIAAGRLKTRVASDIGRRNDEIGMLGRDFDRMTEQIESLVAAQRNLLGDVSHELRSPLARLIVALSLLRRCPSDEAPEYMSRIGLEAIRLDKLIGQLLTLTRIDSGMNGSQRETIDLTNLVQEVAADGDFEARAQNSEVRVLRSDACSVSGFPEMLRSAIENVVRNAIRYSPPGTSVDITLQQSKTSGSRKVLLRVRDYGPGVPSEMLSEIFVPFRRALEQGELTTQGSGLGLAIADRVVRMHEGFIHAANANDGGLIVEMELPITNYDA